MQNWIVGLALGSLPKGKLLSFPSETGHNVTFTTFIFEMTSSTAAELQQLPLKMTSICESSGYHRLCPQTTLPFLAVALATSLGWHICCCSVTAIFLMISFHSSTSRCYSAVITGIRTGVNSAASLALFIDGLLEICCRCGSFTAFKPLSIAVMARQSAGSHTVPAQVC